MPYTTIVSGTPITAAWANANVRDQVVTPFASEAARNAAITAPLAGMVTYITGTNQVQVYNGTSWVCITPQEASVATSQTTNSTSYVDLATPGPSVSLLTGTKALVIVQCDRASSVAGGYANIGVSIGGAAPTQDTVGGPTGTANGDNQVAAGMFYVSSLTPGTNTFKAQYKVVGAVTGTFKNRHLSVVGIP